MFLSLAIVLLECISEFPIYSLFREGWIALDGMAEGAVHYPLQQIK